MIYHDPHDVNRACDTKRVVHYPRGVVFGCAMAPHDKTLIETAGWLLTPGKSADSHIAAMEADILASRARRAGSAAAEVAKT